MRILLVEDEPDLGEAIRQVLSRKRYIVDWVLDGQIAWDYLSDPQMPYTLAVLDWMLPGLSGLELCQYLRAQGNPLPVLMLTARDGMADRVMGLDAGADDYLVKPFGMEELLARLRALQRRSLTLQPQQLKVGRLILDYATSKVWLDQSTTAHTLDLTAKEFQLLEYLMQHPNQLLSQEQLRYRLWDFQSEASSNVVAAQIRLLRRKLAELGYADCIVTVRGLGYRLTVDYETKPAV